MHAVRNGAQLVDAQAMRAAPQNYDARSWRPFSYHDSRHGHKPYAWGALLHVMEGS